MTVHDPKSWRESVTQFTPMIDLQRFHNPNKGETASEASVVTQHNRYRRKILSVGLCADGL
jgi:hypothetical protein